jgi:hypothetical protein
MAASAWGDSGKPRAFARNAALSSDLMALRSAPFISPARAARSRRKTQIQ